MGNDIIVYRNPIEKALWEGQLNWLVLGAFCGVVAAIMLDHYTRGRYPRAVLAAGAAVWAVVSWMLL